MSAAPDCPSATSAPVTDENACIAINYTSGTTGFPKGVMFSHRGAWINAIGEVTEHRLTQRSVYLWTLPLFHCNGWCFSWAVTAAGGRHICLRQPDPREAVRLIEAEGVTHLCGAPVVVSSLAQYCAANGVKFRNPLRIITAGAPPPPAVIRAAEETGAEITHAYGLTETYGPHTICAWKPAWDALPAAERALLKARQGVPYMIAGMDLRVADHYMNDVPADGQTMGEVLMRGNNVMLGYYDNPKATAEAFRGRLVPLRRPRRGASRWLHRTARPHEGHRHLGRREHLFDRSGEGAGRSSRGRRSRHRGRRRREMGRGAQGLRRAEARSTPPPPKS